MAFCINCGKELLGYFEFCPEYGKKVNEGSDESDVSQASFNDYVGKTKICRSCGEEMPEDSFYCLNCGNAFPEQDIEFETVGRNMNMRMGTWRNKWIALILCVFFGWLGIHRFYEGKVFTGLLYLFTLGFLELAGQLI